MPVLGVDIGGSGIKGAPVDIRSGRLTAERFRIATPEPATPKAVVRVVQQIAEHFAWPGIVGVTFPGVVVDGVIHTATNLDKSWLEVNLPALLREKSGMVARALNDADAAGLAEVAHGCAKGVRGVVLVLTFGTGVGSGLFIDGQLVPNTELGHLELNGKDAERQVAESVREKRQWSWKKWAGHVNGYLAELEALFSPDAVVIGGGVAKKPDSFIPLLRTRAPLHVATLGNDAGIVGAAMAAHQALGRRRTTTSRSSRPRSSAGRSAPA